MLLQRGVSPCLCLVALFDAEVACAQNEGAPAAAPREAVGVARYQTPIVLNSGYFQALGSVSLGEGVRFNNPYRLTQELGKSAESLSLSASYVDIGLGVVYGAPDSLAHGVMLHLSIAAVGIPQEVFSLSYLALERWGSGRTILYGRAGIPVILQPDLSGGLEVAAGGAYMITAGVGVSTEFIGSLYYGAGIVGHSVTNIPVLSGQLGIFFNYEVFK